MNSMYGEMLSRLSWFLRLSSSCVRLFALLSLVSPGAISTYMSWSPVVIARLMMRSTVLNMLRVSCAQAANQNEVLLNLHVKQDSVAATGWQAGRVCAVKLRNACLPLPSHKPESLDFKMELDATYVCATASSEHG